MSLEYHSLVYLYWYMMYTWLKNKRRSKRNAYDYALFEYKHIHSFLSVYSIGLPDFSVSDNSHLTIISWSILKSIRYCTGSQWRSIITGVIWSNFAGISKEPIFSTISTLFNIFYIFYNIYSFYTIYSFYIFYNIYSFYTIFAFYSVESTDSCRNYRKYRKYR